MMEHQKKDQKRMIPLTDQFMKNQKIRDRIWTYLQLNSYIGNDENGHQHRFIYKYHIPSIAYLYDEIMYYPVIKDKLSEKIICCYNTFSNSYKLLLEPTQDNKKAIGYLQEGKIIDNNKKLVECYYLREDFTPFKMIPIETLQTLMNLYLDNAIKVYVTLLNWYEFKQQSKEKYNFTKEQLAAAIGYSSHWYYAQIEIILQKLKESGFIQYHTEKRFVNGKNTYNYILDKVNLYVNKDELRPQQPQNINYDTRKFGTFNF